MYYDLHVHSNKSDGKYSRLELLKLADSLKMDYIAFTDHDYFDDNELKIENQSSNINIINGIEMTVSNIKNMHILGYDIQNKEMLKKVLSNLKKENYEICLRLIKNLQKNYGFDISEEYFKDVNLSKGKIRQFLVDKGYVDNVKLAGDLYTGSNSKNYEKTKSLTYKEVIELINNCGGIPILAHPMTLKYDDEKLEKLISDMKNFGLQGIEVLNLSKQTQKQVFYEFLAKKYNLLESCGSDFHRFDHTPDFGVKNNKSLKLIKKIKER